MDDTYAEKVAQWSNDIEMSLLTGDISDVITVEQQRAYLESMNDPGRYGFYIVNAADDEVIGIVRLMRVSMISRTAVVGAFIGDRNVRGKGVGTEAINLILDFGFNAINLRNIMAEVFSFNAASLRLCEKCGFKEIGRRRNAIRYGRHEYDEVFLDILDTEYESASIGKYLA
jgi:RimJ/RimL family protein N-acetyltransferase